MKTSCKNGSVGLLGGSGLSGLLGIRFASSAVQGKTINVKATKKVFERDSWKFGTSPRWDPQKYIEYWMTRRPDKKLWKTGNLSKIKFVFYWKDYTALPPKDMVMSKFDILNSVKKRKAVPIIEKAVPIMEEAKKSSVFSQVKAVPPKAQVKALPPKAIVSSQVKAVPPKAITKTEPLMGSKPFIKEKPSFVKPTIAPVPLAPSLSEQLLKQEIAHLKEVMILKDKIASLEIQLLKNKLEAQVKIVAQSPDVPPAPVQSPVPFVPVTVSSSFNMEVEAIKEQIRQRKVYDANLLSEIASVTSEVNEFVVKNHEICSDAKSFLSNHQFILELADAIKNNQALIKEWANELKKVIEISIRLVNNKYLFCVANIEAIELSDPTLTCTDLTVKSRRLDRHCCDEYEIEAPVIENIDRINENQGLEVLTQEPEIIEIKRSHYL